jgi:hypothetical protein
MGMESRRRAKKENRRRRRIARACTRDDTAQLTSINDIPDDLLELTLLRIPSAAGIIRAAATCKLWRRVIGNAGFLRRFRRLHGPLIVGHHYYDEGTNTDFDPLADAPAAIGNMSKSVPIHFVPVSGSDNAYEWPGIYQYPELYDSRGGLLALYRSASFRIMVFSPWIRRSREVYALMSEGYSYNHCLGVFLLDSAAGEPDETLAMSNFRVLYVHLIRHGDDGTETVQAWVFSARDHLWLQLGTSTRAVGNISQPPFKIVGRVGGSICWCSKYNNNTVLMLDESTGEFSEFTLPGHAGSDRNTVAYYDRTNLRVIDGDVDTVHLVRIVGDDNVELLRYARRVGGSCMVERRVRVAQMASIDESRHNRRWQFSETAEAAAPGRVVLSDSITDVDYICKISVDKKSIELERVQKPRTRTGCRVFPYELPWTVSACL